MRLGGTMEWKLEIKENAHPNANAILSFQTKREISMHPKQSSKQIKKRSREHQT